MVSHAGSDSRGRRLHGSREHGCLYMKQKAAPKCDKSILRQFPPSLQHTHTLSQHNPPPPTTTIPTPPLGPLQPAACLWRSPLTSAARLGRVPALWALDGCGWSEKQSAVCGAHGTDSTRPAQTHLMTRKHPTGPLPLPLFCLSHTLTIEGDTCEDE